MYNPSRKVANWYWDDLRIFLQACSKFNRAMRLHESVESGNDFEVCDVFERCYNSDLEELEKAIREADELRRITLKWFNRQCGWAHVSPVSDEQCEKFLEDMSDGKRREYYKGVIHKFREAKLPTVLSIEEIETKYQNICAKRREKLGGANYVG